MDILFYIFFIITIGGNVVLWGGLSVDVYWKGNEKASITFIIGLLANFLFNKFLKLTFRLPRPSNIPWKQFGTPYGFPSGHIQTIAFVTSYFSLETGKEHPKLSYFLFILTVLVSYSRIFLGYHYLYDVLGGGVIGFSTGFLYWKGKEIFWNQFQISQNLLVFSTLTSFMIGFLVYLVSPLYPMLIAGIIISTIPPYTVFCKLKEDTKPVNLTHKTLFKKLFLGNLSILLIGYLIYSVYLSERPLGILLSCFLGGIWTFYLYPHLFSYFTQSSPERQHRNDFYTEESRK